MVGELSHFLQKYCVLGSRLMAWVIFFGSFRTLTRYRRKKSKKIQMKVKQDFPGDPVVKNPPSNAGDVGSVLGREN